MGQLFNLSSKELTCHQEKVLNYSLKFVPTNLNVDLTEAITDLKEWERRMRLAEYFADKGDRSQDFIENQYRKKSGWTPPEGRDKWLDLYLESVSKEIIQNINQHQQTNMTDKDLRAIQELVMDNSIIIRPADKGSGIAIIDTDEYINKIEKELQDTTTYKQMDRDITKDFARKAEKIVNRLHRNGYITKDTKNYMLPKNARPGKVKGNPKIHKPDIPYRIIISGIGHATEKIAEIAEKELEQHVKSLSSYIQDTFDFINKLKTLTQPLPKNAILFCMDVKSLYPNVPKSEGRRACEMALNTRSDRTIPTEEVIEMIDLTLENNNFEFNVKRYLQIDGTAIGSRL